MSVLGIPDDLLGSQERALLQIDNAFVNSDRLDLGETYRRSDAPAMQQGWDEMIWWVRNGCPYSFGLDITNPDDDEIATYCERLVSAGKAIGDRAVVDEMREAIRLHKSTKLVRIDEIGLVDILTAMKGF